MDYCCYYYSWSLVKKNAIITLCYIWKTRRHSSTALVLVNTCESHPWANSASWISPVWVCFTIKEYIVYLEASEKFDPYAHYSNGLEINCRIETRHVKPSTSIRFCISIKMRLKLPRVRWLAGFMVLRGSWVITGTTASRIHWWSWQSMYLWQAGWIRPQTVSPFNCFSFQWQFVQCLLRKESEKIYQLSFSLILPLQFQEHGKNSKQSKSISTSNWTKF